MLNYRKAGTTDIASLTNLRLQFLREVNSKPIHEFEILSRKIRQYFEATLPHDLFIAWLGEIDGQIIATSGLSFYQVPPSHNNTNGKIAYIMNMYTLPEYRRKGIASVLFEKIIQEAKKTDAGKIVLHATDDGRSLYTRYGFREHHGEMVLAIRP